MMSSLLARLRRFFFLVLGGLRWTPPPWLARSWAFMASFVGARVRKIGEFRRNSPRQFRLTMAGVATGVALVAGTVYWLETRPRPVLTQVSVSAPAATVLDGRSKPQPLTIRFDESVARLESVGKPVEQGITMSPELPGRWSWTGGKQLEFVLADGQDWPVGQQVVIRLDRALFPGHVTLETYEVEFATAAFSASIESARFYRDPREADLKKIVATVTFSHPVDTKAFEKAVSLSYKDGGQRLAVRVDYDKFFGKAFLHSEPVKVPDKDREVIVAVEDDFGSSRGGPELDKDLETRVTVPGVDNLLKISRIAPAIVRNSEYEPEQMIVVSATTGVPDKEMRGKIEAFVLPRNPPKRSRLDTGEEQWTSVGQVTREALAEARRLELTPLPTAHENSELHSFRFEAAPGQTLYVRIDKGLRSFDGYRLANARDELFQVPEFPKEVKVMHPGSLLSLSGERTLSVLAQDLPAVRFEIAKVVPSQVGNLVSQTGGRFDQPYFNYSWTFGQDNLTERFHRVRKIEPTAGGKPQYLGFDFTEYVRGTDRLPHGLFFFRAEGWNPVTETPTGHEDRRFILVTDLGLIAKRAFDGSYEVFVQSIRTGEPVAGAQVSIYGKNGIPVFSRATDATGRTSFPTLKDFTREQTPTVWVAKAGQDLSFLPYERHDRALNLSRFDVAGRVTSSAEKDLDAYLFSDRGIYRPGETFHVGMIVKPGDWTRSVAGIPLEAVVTDPRGMEVRKSAIRLGRAGFEELDYTPSESSPTGRYGISLYVVKDGRREGLLAETGVQVEEFVPDRMKISARFSTEREQGWVSPKGLSARVTLKNLFGTPAGGRPVKGTMSFTASLPSFKQYSDFVFTDPLREKEDAVRFFREELAEKSTNDDGEAVFDLDLDRFEPALYRMTFYAEGFEAEGGRAVGATRTMLVSPLPYVVGYKADGSLQYIRRGTERKVRLVAVGPDLKPVEAKGLKLELSRYEYVSTLARQSDDTYRYESVRRETPVKTDELAIGKAAAEIVLPTSEPGDYLAVLRGPAGAELTRLEFTVAGDAQLAGGVDRDAELQIKLDRSDYEAGDTIELQIKAPYKGAGLITIERESVKAHRWFKTDSTTSVQKIRVPEGLEGNGYVTVAFTRDLHSREIFMSPLSYGAVPFSISRARRMNPVSLSLPERIRPGEELKIGYRARRPGKIAVIAVDEGILQVARYRTPDPLAHFFQKRALEVTTSQLLDLILPEFSIARKLSAPGGDAMGGAAPGANLNPFKRPGQKPVAYWSGIIDVGTEEKTLSYEVPDHFNGSLRVMAVAVSQDSIGVAEESLLVRGPFIISSNVPLFVSPGDEFTVSVNITNNLEKAAAAQGELEVTVPAGLKGLDPLKRKLSIPASKDVTETFRFKAETRLGGASLAFLVRSGSETVRAAMGLSIRPAVARRTTVQTGLTTDGSEDLAIKRRMHPEFRNDQVSVSAAPLGLATGLMGYLNAYPYGCTEQIVSQAFPMLVLRDQADFKGLVTEIEDSAGVRKLDRVEVALDTLLTRQNGDGSFGFWAPGVGLERFAAVYAAHFLTEAADRDKPQAVGLLTRAVPFLEEVAGGDLASLERARTAAYAAYVLTRNGRLTTSLLREIEERAETDWPKAWRSDLLAAYLASSHRLLQQDEAADKLIGGVKLSAEVEENRDAFHSRLFSDGMLLYLLSRHFPNRAKEIPAEAMQTLIQPLLKGDFSTISSSALILGLNEYTRRAGSADKLAVTVAERVGGKSRPVGLKGELVARGKFSPEAAALEVRSQAGRPVYFQALQAGFDSAAPAKAVSDGIEIQREYVDADGRTLTSLALGGTATVRLRLRSTSRESHANIAVVDLLPGGFELIREFDSLPSGVQYVDGREDRLLIFANVGTDVLEISYRIRATNRGKYSVPPAYAEHMYDSAIQALALGGEIEVR